MKKRVKAIRSLMKKHWLAAYLVPRTAMQQQISQGRYVSGDLELNIKNASSKS